MSSATTIGSVALDDESTMVVLGVVEDSGSSELGPAVSPIPTSDDESEDSNRGGDVRVDQMERGLLLEWAQLFAVAKPWQFL